VHAVVEPDGDDRAAVDHRARVQIGDHLHRRWRLPVNRLAALARTPVL
jgi:hypothetical protein